MCAKVTRTACRRNSQSHILRATKFGDIIADHKVVNEVGESRNNHRYAIVVQDSMGSMLDKNFTRNGEESTEVSRS